MTTGDFEKNSWGWQLSVFQRQVGEWWELQKSKFESALPRVPNWSLPKWSEDLIKAIAWLLLGLVLLRLGWQLWRLLEPLLYSLVSQAKKSDRITTTTSELPEDAWLKRSQTYFHKGNYREACRCLYMAMLQRLHDKAIAPHQQARTDGEYLQLVQELPQSQSYQTLIAIHEQLCFGNAEMRPETFAQCQQAYGEIGEKE